MDNRKVDKTEFWGKDVVAFRKAHGMQQSDLAELLGVTKGAVEHWEADRRHVPEPVVRILILFESEPKLMSKF